MRKFIITFCFTLGVCGITTFGKNYQDLKDVVDFINPPPVIEFKQRTQEELYEEIRKQYTDPPDPPALDLKLTKAQIDQIRKNGMGSNRCVTCNYQGDDPNMY